MRTGNKRGFSLTELVATIVVGAIVILTVAALGSIVYQSYNNLRNNSGVYNDAQFALQLMREGVRQSSTTVPSPVGNCLTITTTAGTNYYYTMASGNTSSLVFGSSACGNTTNESIISGVTNLVFTPSTSTSTAGVELVTVALSGTKNGVTFSYTMSASRRNP